GQAEELRRAMGFKRSVERMQEIERDLRAGMSARGLSQNAQEEIVRGIKSFALYGFPESHAASFALIAYASAYLKAHHGAAFLCALLNCWPMGFYHPATLVTDARRHDIETLPIDVLASSWSCTLERTDKGQLAVRLGLRFASGLREKTGRAIAAEAQQRPFTSLADFHARVDTLDAERTTLAEVGAFARLGGTRRQVLWQIEALGRSGALFDAASARAEDERPEESETNARASRGELPEMDAFEESLVELRGSSISTGQHPVSFARASLVARGVKSAAEVARMPDGVRARIGGVVIVRQRPGTAKGLVFITLEDETGFANAVVFPDCFQKWRRVILSNRALVIEGKVQNRDGVTTLLSERFEPLVETPQGSDISRNFQ
ncbi:MAG TPA: OB-fold nucleic acid binding domain-containing protein, partial [Polyangia bacterium]